MTSLHRRLRKIERKLKQRNSLAPRLILKTSTREGVKYVDGNELISAGQLRDSDTICVLVMDPLPDFIIARWQEEALQENARRDAARKPEAELGNSEK